MNFYFEWMFKSKKALQMILIYVQNYDILEFVNRYPNGIHYLKLKSELQKDESPENCFEDFFAFLGTKLDGST